MGYVLRRTRLRRVRTSPQVRTSFGLAAGEIQLRADGEGVVISDPRWTTTSPPWGRYEKAVPPVLVSWRDPPQTPGSIHEGGELGYSLPHAYAAAFDNPNLVVRCVVGNGEAETGPLAVSWHSQQVREPRT